MDAPPRAEGYHWCGCLAWLSGYAFNDSLDYRYRNYDNGERRDDKALRWNGAVSRTIRSRDIAELTGSWTHSQLDGKASASLAAFGGREFATHDRPDGDSDFVRLSPSLDFALTEHLGGFVFASWQHDRYNDERFNVGASDEILGTGTRNDDHHGLVAA